MRTLRALPLLVTLACDTGPSAEMERLLAKDRRLQEQRAEEAAQWEALRERKAERARAALGDKLHLSIDDVRENWTVQVMSRALAVGMVDPSSGLCAVLVHWDDALIVFSLGRPPKMPYGEEDLYAGLSDVRFGHMVHARDDFRELLLWRQQSCDGDVAEPF